MSWWHDFFLSGSYTLLDDIPPERTQTQVDFVVRALSLDERPRDAPLLDIACGIGRHSQPLAARGIRVVGLDYTPAFLERALAQSNGLPARFVRGDMRRLPFRDRSFVGAMNLFTSFGYFETDEDHATVLNEVGRVLRPGGLFLLDIQNRDGIARGFQAAGWSAIPDGFLLEGRVWESRTGRIVSTWTFLRHGEAQAYTVSVRLFTFQEIERMLAAAGLAVVDVWGDWEGGSLSLDSRRMIVKASKAS